MTALGSADPVVSEMRTWFVPTAPMRNGFVWDDEVLVRKNPYIHNLRCLPTLFTSYLVHNSHGGSVYYHPLQAIKYLLDYQLGVLIPPSTIAPIFSCTRCAW